MFDYKRITQARSNLEPTIIQALDFLEEFVTDADGSRGLLDDLRSILVSDTNQDVFDRETEFPVEDHHAET